MLFFLNRFSFHAGGYVCLLQERKSGLHSRARRLQSALDSCTNKFQARFGADTAPNTSASKPTDQSCQGEGNKVVSQKTVGSLLPETGREPSAGCQQEVSRACETQAARLVKARSTAKLQKHGRLGGYQPVAGVFHRLPQV